MGFIRTAISAILPFKGKPRAKKVGGVLTGPQFGGDGTGEDIRKVLRDWDNKLAGTNNAEFKPPPPGSYEVYERMAKYPTLKLATLKIVAPCYINPWGWSGQNEDTNQKWIDDAKAEFDPMRVKVLKMSFRAFTYGWSPAEIIFGSRTGYRGVVDLKPLDPRKCQWLANESDGEVVGLRNTDALGNEVDLPLSNVYAYINGEELPYGCSLYESARDSGCWSNAIQIMEKSGRYICKIAGVIWEIHYPTGTSRDAMGVERPNEWLARMILADLTAGRNIRIPNKYASMVAPGDTPAETAASIEKALKLAGLSDWQIKCYHPEGSDFSEGFIKNMQYDDELMVRSTGLPDRAVLPAQRNSRADSQTQDNTADMLSQLHYSEVCGQFMAQVVNPWGMARYGDRADKQIVLEAPPLSIENSKAIETILTALAGNNDIGTEIAGTVDLDSALDDLHVPVLPESRGQWLTKLKALAQRKKLADAASQAQPSANGTGRMAKHNKED